MTRILSAAVLFAGLMSLAAWSASAAPSVPPAAPPAKGGFLFTTFKGEATSLTEQIYFGLSADGLHWEALNGGNPVLVSEIGEKGVRDPYLLRAHDGKFILLATDLSINLNNDWTRATHAGSKSIVIWESTDLVKWSQPRLLKVAPDDAGCTWAPEAMYDEDTKDYRVYWASTTASDNYAKQRIWSVRTADFKTFTKAEIYIEKPTTVIDTDIIRDGHTYYRFTKDEKNKAITMEAADRVAGPWKDVEGFSLATMQGYEGPACFQLTPAMEGKPATWCLLLDYYSRGQGYKPFTTTDLASGKFTANNEITFPYRFRHGSVLPLSAEEYQRVKAAYK
jgi:arabinoxylan arabinofuranohydrolase